jgi:hypothetical protein
VKTSKTGKEKQPSKKAAPATHENGKKVEIISSITIF